MNVQALTAFDLGVLGVIGLSALLALARGAVREVLGILTWIGAIAAAFIAFPRLRPLVGPYIQEPLIADAVTLAAVFIIPFILLKIVTSLFARLVSAAELGALDRLLGFAFGVVRGLLIVCAAYLVLSVFLPAERQPVWVREARLLPQVQRGAFRLAQALPANARILGEMVRPPEAAPPPAAPPATGAKPVAAGQHGYSDAQRQGVDRLLGSGP